MQQTEEPTLLGPDEGPAFWVLTDHLRFKASAADTGGAYVVGVSAVQPGGGPPPHVHHREDELFYILDGELEFVLGDRAMRGRAGDAVFLPRGVIHTFKNPLERPTTFFLGVTPAGFDAFYADAGYAAEPGPPGTAPPVTPAAVDRLMAAAAKHQLDIRPDHVAPNRVDIPRHAEQVWALGEHVSVKLTAERTNGQFTVAEITSLPGGGVPPHRHLDCDELFYVLAGTYTFAVGDRTWEAGPESFARVPKGVWHGFKNTGGANAKLLDVHTPGGFEAFFRDCGDSCADFDAGPPNVLPPPAEKLVALLAKHGMELKA